MTFTDALKEARRLGALYPWADVRAWKRDGDRDAGIEAVYEGGSVSGGLAEVEAALAGMQERAVPASKTPKWRQAVAVVLSLIDSGLLRPGDPVMPATVLAERTGLSPMTCRRALQALTREGVLALNAGIKARRVVAGGEPSAEEAARTRLARALAEKRQAAGLHQPELAERIGFSVTSVAHAETGRIWQSQKFWTRADTVLGCGGELLRLRDGWRRAARPGSVPDRDERALGM